MSVDLIFYKENYGGQGKIPDAEFPIWERRAESKLGRITGGKSTKADDMKVKLCICEMAELLYDVGKRCGISSENNDGYSVVYESEDIKNKLLEIAKDVLSGTKFLYRGV